MARPHRTTGSRFERVTNLTLTLLAANHPLSLDHLVSTIPGYPLDAGSETIRKAFERDKRIVRQSGLCVIADGVESDASTGYRIVDDAKEGVVLSFDANERAALVKALGIVRASERDNLVSVEATLKLARSNDGGASASSALPAEHVHRLIQVAIAQRRTAHFVYGSRVCDVEPYGIARDQNDWILVARDRHHGGSHLRRFKMSRITSTLRVGDPHSYELPEVFDPEGSLARGDWPTAFASRTNRLEAVTNRALDSSSRLRRLLAILRFLARSDEVRLDNLAASCHMQKAELVRELQIAMCCGIAPFTPDALLELVFDDVTITAYGLEWLLRAENLTLAETLVARDAAMTLLSVPDLKNPEPLERAIEKIDHALGATCNMAPGETSVWPYEWSTILHVRVTERNAALDALSIEPPMRGDDGWIEITALIADRRWTSRVVLKNDSAASFSSTPRRISERRAA